MLTREELLEMNKELQEKVAKEIENIKNGISGRHLYQLIQIQYELKKMQYFDCIDVIYPMIIVDSWDLTKPDNLRSQLMHFDYEYKKYLKELERQERKKNK